MRCIHYPPSLPFLPFYMLIAICDSFHSNSRTYATISTAYCVLYPSIIVATRVHICTRVSLIATHVSYVGCQYQYSHTPPFDIKNNKTRLMEICWALIINYLNCINLLNIRNYSIPQSINIGLRVGTNKSILGEQSNVDGIYSEYWSSRTQIPLVAEESLSQ